MLPTPGDRVPGTFDQDVYVELLHRYFEAGSPANGTVSFTLHAFLRAMGRRVDGRTYGQLRGALARLERSILESTGAYFAATAGEPPLTTSRPTGRYVDDRLTLLTAVAIDRRRAVDRDQLALFATLSANEPGEAHVTLSPAVRANIGAGYTTTLSATRYFELPSPTARRLYRLIAAVQAEEENGHGTAVDAPDEAADGAVEPDATVARASAHDVENGARARQSSTVEAVADHSPHARPTTRFVWNVALDALAEQLPLSQRYPSHLQRVLEPAHAMLKAAGVVREAVIRQQRRAWVVHYELP